MTAFSRSAPARSFAARSAALVIGLFGTAPASACTLCHSRLADEVRVAVMGPEFWGTLAAIAAPLPLLAAAVWLVGRLSA